MKMYNEFILEVATHAMTVVQITNVFTRLINNAAYSQALRSAFMNTHKMTNVNEFDAFLTSISPANFGVLLATNGISFIRDNKGYFAFHSRTGVLVTDFI